MSSSPKTDQGQDEKGTVATTRTRSRDFEGGALPETRDVYDEEDSGVDPVYHAKARVLNDALQEIGMGKYQVRILSLRNAYAMRARGMRISRGSTAGAHEYY